MKSDKINEVYRELFKIELFHHCGLSVAEQQNFWKFTLKIFSKCDKSRKSTTSLKPYPIQKQWGILVLFLNHVLSNEYKAIMDLIICFDAVLTNVVGLFKKQFSYDAEKNRLMWLEEIHLPPLHPNWELTKIESWERRDRIHRKRSKDFWNF